jgi:hypothetical protein
VGVVKSVEKKKSVDAQLPVKYRSEMYGWTQKLNREDYGSDKYLSTPTCPCVPLYSCSFVVYQSLSPNWSNYSSVSSGISGTIELI